MGKKCRRKSATDFFRNIPSITGHSPDFTQWFAVESLTLWDSRTVSFHPYLTNRCGGRWIYYLRKS